MRGFVDSIVLFSKDVLSRYAVEAVLLTAAAILSILAVTAYFHSSSAEKKEDISLANNVVKKSSAIKEQKIFVHVAGAVVKPDVYQMNFGARIKDILSISGGLSDLADREFFYRNFNLSRVLTDQEKIYIPTIQDITKGYFQESTKILDYNDPVTVAESVSEKTKELAKINLNLATAEELETISGIGKSLSLKIIQNRPYRRLDELLIRQVLGKNLFQKIKSALTI